VKFDSISFEAPSIHIVGGGEMEYHTLKLDLNLTTRNPNAMHGPLTDIVAGIKNELIGIHVGGTLTEPKAQVKSFTGIKGSWEQVFGKKSQAPNKLGPSTAAK
jgi:hypothetical protein